MAEYSSVTLQTVNPGESFIFTESPVPCTRGFVRHRDDTGSFLLSGWVPYTYGCNCKRPDSALYLVDFGANIAVPTGETVGEISVGIQIDGSTVGSSIMIATPAAVEQFFNVSRALNVQVWRGCCESVSVVNLSTIPILAQNANIIFARPDLNVTR